MIGFIMAGGKGTRLSEITKNEIPKPMAEIAGKPILLHAIERLRENGINDIILSVGFLHEKIEEYFGNGEKFGVNIQYIVEKEPLGSGGALYFLKDKVKDDFLVCSGDTIFDIDIDRMYQYHKEKKSLITMLTHPNFHPYDSDIIKNDKNGRVLEILKKNEERNFYYNNNVNAGFFIISPNALSFFKELKKINMEHDFIDYFIKNTDRVFSYKSFEYIKDVGTPERFLRTEEDIKSNHVRLKNFKFKQKAVFLDRDGTINKYKGFIKKSDEIELLPNVTEAIKKLNLSEYLTIVISNQPVIARGEASFDDVEEMFKKIETELGKEGSYIDGYFYCPHHPHKGFEGEVPELKIDCMCRKPKIGLLEKASEDYNIDLESSYFIGDGNIDVKTGQNAKMKTIKVRTGIEEIETEKPDFEAENLNEAVDFVLGK